MADDATAGVDLICPFCGYNLRGTPGVKCSECGKEFDRSTMTVSQIPWSHRRKIGRMRAFVKTCWMVTWRPGKLAEEMNRPVSLKDAMAFRRVVWVLMCLPGWGVMGWAMGAEWFHWTDGRNDVADTLTKCVPMPWSGLLLVVTIGIFWWGITGGASLFFRPRGMEAEQQNRAVTLSHYAGATWLGLYPYLLFIASVLIASLWLEENHRAEDFELFLLAGGQIVLFVLAIWRIWWVPIILMRRVTHCGTGRTVWAAVGIPLCWLGMGVVAATIVVVAMFVDVIRASLH